jgi:hypothetical protein
MRDLRLRMSNTRPRTRCVNTFGACASNFHNCPRDRGRAASARVKFGRNGVTGLIV